MSDQSLVPDPETSVCGEVAAYATLFPPGGQKSRTSPTRSVSSSTVRVPSSATGYYCAVPGCSNRSGICPTLSFHRFPACLQRRRDLLHAIRREVGKIFKIASNTRVCSEHFKQSDFRRTEGLGLLILSNAAVPSLFSWPEKAKKSRRAVVRRGEQPSTGQVAEEQQSRTLSDR